MSTSLTTLANAAAQQLGVLDSGEGLSAQQLTDTLATANAIFDNWSSEGLFAIADLITTFPTVASTQSYTIGAAQTIALTRPVRIVAAAFKNSAGPGGPMKILNEQQWAALPDRQRLSWILEGLFWDRGTPNGVVYLSPVPIGVLTVELHTWIPLTQFADTTTPITFAPGYLWMAELAVAMGIASVFDTAIPAAVSALFADAAGRIRKLNASLIGDIPEEVLQESK